MKSIIRLHDTNLHKIASLGNEEKGKIVGVKILGDSLSDRGGKNGMYDKKIFGCIPLSLFLNKSPHKQFTNGFVWNYAFEKELEFSRKSHNPLENPNLSGHGFFKVENRAQGGATAYNYGKLINLILHPIGFLCSLIVTNIGSEAKKLKKHKLSPDDLAIIFAGANDFVTAGYCGSAGSKRALEGIANGIEILTTSEKKDEDFVNHILVFTLPDFSKTPRFYKKSEKKRKQAQEACYFFNEGLKNIAKGYQYLNFNFCDIYQIEKKEDMDLSKFKGKGILITGVGDTKKVYFIDRGKFIFREGEEISVNIKLSRTEKILLGEKKGKLAWKTKEGESLIHKLCSKAKLTANVKVFDAAAVFEKIDNNPEAYGFTNGCAVYYLDKNQDKECISQQIKLGNAVIIKEINQEYNIQNKLPPELICYYIKDGKLVEHGTGAMRVPAITKFALLRESKRLLSEKLKEHPLKDGLSKLADCGDLHDLWTIYIIQSAIQAYKTKFNKTILLADVYASVLLGIKKHLVHEQAIFWDDLHPSIIVHFLLETMFEPFFRSNYEVKQLKSWVDDMAIHGEISPKVEFPRRHSLP